MKKIALTCLLLLGSSIGNAKEISINDAPNATRGHELIAKKHHHHHHHHKRGPRGKQGPPGLAGINGTSVTFPQVATSLTFQYFPELQPGTVSTDTWQFMVLDPAGTLWPDNSNGPISMSTLYTSPLSFTINAPTIQGVYTVIFYVLNRTSSTSVDVTQLSPGVGIVPGSGSDLFTLQYLSGNTNSTKANDTAQGQYALFLVP